MFGIKPLKTLIVLAFLFLIFLATRQDSKSTSTQKANTEVIPEISRYLNKKPPKILDPRDALKVLHYLFHTKVKDSAISCSYKKGKSKYFAACKNGDFIKNNYWEISLEDNNLKLLARSKTAIYIINTYHFKELSHDSKQAHPKVEKAIKSFFNN